MKNDKTAESIKNEDRGSMKNAVPVLESAGNTSETDARKTAEKIVKKYDTHVLHRNSGKGKTIEYIVAIAVNIVLLYVLANLSDFSIPFLTDDFMLVVPAFRLSSIATILGNIILLAYDRAGFRALIHCLLNIVALYVLYQLYFFFPFSLPTGATDWLPFAFKNVFLIAMAGVGIATLIEFVEIFHRY